MKAVATLAVAWVVAVAVPAAGAAAAAEAGGALKEVRLDGIPHVKQLPDFCGEACAEMVLRKLGARLTQDDVFDAADVDVALGRGLHTAELKQALERMGFKPGPVWTPVGGADRAKQLDAAFAAMHADLLRGVPSIVCMYSREGEGASEHFRLVVGYDAKEDAVVYHEPAAEAGEGAYRTMSRATFLKTWPLRAGPRDSGVAIRLAMAADDKPRDARARAVGRHRPAAYAQHVLALKAKLPAGFSLVIEHPFVIVGDDPAPRLRQHGQRTVRWAVDLLRNDFFEKDPDEVLTIWLFKDRASYEKHVKAIFGRAPHTPYGYYSAADKALVMNIATGGGTLVHEIVHPFVRANFAGCPAWFNEGLGSLFEQCAERDGHIVGLTNWRLAGLQKAIAAGKVPTFKALCSTTDAEFYNEDPGTNYAQARYLCYYLQEKGLLTKFYKEFRASAKEDPSGHGTLQRVLGEQDMGAFKERWERFVMGLRFP